jgi:hypothetical protein
MMRAKDHLRCFRGLSKKKIQGQKAIGFGSGRGIKEWAGRWTLAREEGRVFVKDISH